MLEGAALRNRVLFLSRQLEQPQQLELIEHLFGEFEIQLIVTSDHAGADRRRLAAITEFCVEVEVHGLDPGLETSDLDDSSVLEPRCAAATGRVGEILAHGAADLVHVSGCCSMQHVPGWSAVPLVLTLSSEELASQRLPLRRPVLAAAAWKRRLACWEQADAIAVSTEEDRDEVLVTLPGANVHVLPADGERRAAKLIEIYRAVLEGAATEPRPAHSSSQPA